MRLVPLTHKAACTFIADKHRHHKPPQGLKFAIGLEEGGDLIGVVCVGRPVSRHLDDGYTAEVTRLCTDGSKNACSKLYAAAANAAKSMGYHKIITYILASEPGTSLKASGFEVEGQTRGGSWDAPSRPRTDKHPTEPKLRWSKRLTSYPQNS
jgi:hypothetical protein